MTIQELRKSLPNGFHDSYLKKIEFSLENGALMLCFDILVSSVGESTRYEPADVHVRELIAFIVEGPKSKEEISDVSVAVLPFDTSSDIFLAFDLYPPELRAFFTVSILTVRGIVISIWRRGMSILFGLIPIQISVKQEGCLNR